MQEKNPRFYPVVPSEGVYKAKNSKFYAFLFPCTTLEAIEKELSTLRKKYFDATHIVYAWRLGFEKISYRANDDGEPTYSAGMPVYRQIVSNEISDVLIAVVRYFGGTKLGISGLVEAYETAAKIAIQNTQLEPFIPKVSVLLTCDLQNAYGVYSLAHQLNLQILREIYLEQQAIFELQIPKAVFPEFVEKSQNFNFQLKEI